MDFESCDLIGKRREAKGVSKTMADFGCVPAQMKKILSRRDTEFAKQGSISFFSEPWRSLRHGMRHAFAF